MSRKRKKPDGSQPIINAKARHKYFVGDKYEAGLVLCGTEVKSIRSGNVQISESFAKFIKDELFLFNAHVAEYQFGGEDNHEPQRSRKLLMSRRELDRLKMEVEAGGKTLVPLRLYFKGALIKIEIGVCTGKNMRDKRQDLKRRVANREAEQALKELRQR